MKKLSWVSLLKLRGSYGVIGNNNIGNYTQYNTINITKGGVFGSTVVNGSQVTNLGNSNLGWEKTKQLDLGIDFSFLNNRITLTYDYYKKLRIICFIPCLSQENRVFLQLQEMWVK